MRRLSSGRVARVEGPSRRCHRHPSPMPRSHGDGQAPQTLEAHGRSVRRYGSDLRSSWTPADSAALPGSIGVPRRRPSTAVRSSPVIAARRIARAHLVAGDHPSISTLGGPLTKPTESPRSAGRAHPRHGMPPAAAASLQRIGVALRGNSFQWLTGVGLDKYEYPMTLTCGGSPSGRAGSPRTFGQSISAHRGRSANAVGAGARQERGEARSGSRPQALPDDSLRRDEPHGVAQRRRARLHAGPPELQLAAAPTSIQPYLIRDRFEESLDSSAVKRQAAQCFRRALSH
jgi:hypothetical protein